RSQANRAGLRPVWRTKDRDWVRVRPVYEEILMETEFRLTVNGAERSVNGEPDTALLDVLRHDLGLAGPKFGCGMGLCGACLVLIEGRARSSCDLPVSAVGGPRASGRRWRRWPRR